MTRTEALDKVRQAIDQLDNALDAVQPFLPAAIKVAVPIVDALRKLIDSIDDAAHRT